MNRQSEYREALNSLYFTQEQKAQLAARAAETAATGSRPSRRPVGRLALIAACLVVALAGTTLAVTGAPGSLLGWFAQQWQESSGTVMTQAQSAAIEALTQPVGVSDTCSGITVTLDSITVGDSCLWLLLKADGNFSTREDPSLHYFDYAELEFAFDPDTADTVGGYGSDYGFVGIAEDGRLTLLLRYTITLTQEDSLFTGYDVVLELEDLMHNGSVYLEGSWTLPFTIISVERQVLPLESAIVPARDHENGGAEAMVELTDIQVSATGIRFAQAAGTQTLYPDLSGVLLADGTEAAYSGGGSHWLGEVGSSLWVSDYYWQLPVELSQVTALKFGSIEIPLT